MVKPYRVDVYNIDQKKEQPKKHYFSAITPAMDFIEKLIQNKKLAFFLYRHGDFKASFGHKLKMMKQQKE